MWGNRSALHKKFSKPLKDGVAAIFQIHPDLIREWESSLEEKDRPREELGGKSWRDAQIWLSEDVMKPAFGKEIFGMIAYNGIQATLASRTFAPFICFSDSGFVDEARYLVNRLGKANFFLIRIHRNGHTFDGDSRSYITLDGVKTFDFQNTLDIEKYHWQMRMLVGEWLDMSEKDYWR